MEQTLLTPQQKAAINFVAQEKNLASFYLTGGTALSAFYLFHRISDDLDFFSFEKPDIIFLHSFTKELKRLLGAQNMRYERLYDRNQFFFHLQNGELKIEFTHYPFRQLEKPGVTEGILLDSIRDIAANKLAALTDRFDPKDFVDLYFILQTKTLQTIREDAQIKFGMDIDDIFLGGELAKVRRVEALPKMIKPLTLKVLKKIFEEEAKKLSPNILL